MQENKKKTKWEKLYDMHPVILGELGAAAFILTVFIDDKDDALKMMIASLLLLGYSTVAGSIMLKNARNNLKKMDEQKQYNAKINNEKQR